MENDKREKNERKIELTEDILAQISGGIYTPNEIAKNDSVIKNI